MELSVRLLHSSYHLSLYAEIISMKSRFWEICLRFNCLLLFHYHYLFSSSFFMLLFWAPYSLHLFQEMLIKNLILVEILLFFKQYYQGGVEMIRRDLLTGHWKPYLERAISLKPCYEGGINGGEVNFSLLKFYVSILGKEFKEKDKFSSIKFLVEHFLSTY